MTAIVMKVKNAMAHPNADALRLYSMNAPGHEMTQIIANMENVYEEGDHAVVALADCVLKDGTTIRAAKVRNVSSYGMALGKTDLPVGTDLTEEYCRDDTTNGFRMLKWTDIESLYNVRRSLVRAQQERVVRYIAKVKLDGTNAAVQVATDGRIIAQSRNNIITPESDNHGFAKWADDNKDYFSRLANSQHTTIYGEWGGAGIQSGTSFSQVDHKVFVVFAIQYGGVAGKAAQLDINPVTIEQRLGNRPDNVYVLPFYGQVFAANYINPDELQQTVDMLNEEVAKVEACDPWVKETFGIEGIGEGLVLYPLETGLVSGVTNEPILIDGFTYSDLVFKAKGEKHRVKRDTSAVQMDPETVESINSFVELMATDNRLNQMLKGVELERENIGLFIKKVSKDIHKEGQAELEASGLDWKKVSKFLSTKARAWFISKIDL